MPSVRSLFVAVAVAAVGTVLLPAAASADEPGSTTVVGELVQTWPEDGPAHHDAGHADEGPLTWVETAQGDAVRVSTEALAGVPVGSTVEVSVGGRVQDAATTEDGYEPAREVLGTDVVTEPREPVLPARRITNQVTVALVAPRGAQPDGVTVQQVVDAVDGPVADFWAEQSGGAVSVGVTAAHDWLTTRAGCSDPTRLWDEAARAVGFRPGPGRHLLLYVSSQPGDLAGCSYALAQVGSAPASGGRLYVRDTIPSVIAHELGHNFGLGHSSGLQCDGAVETGTCRTAAYRDFYDVMGVSWDQVGSLNAAQAARLGLLPAAAQQRLSVGDAAAQTALSPLSGRTGTRALRLTGGGADWWLEYRTATGRDAWLGADANRYGLDAGVLVHRVGDLPDTSLLLDATPGAAAGWEGDLQTALPVGVPVTFGGGAFTVTVDAASAEGAAITVVPSPVTRAAVAPVPESGGAPDGDVLAGAPCTACATPSSGAGSPAPSAPSAGRDGTPASPEAAASAGAEVLPAAAADPEPSTGTVAAAVGGAAGSPVAVPLAGAVLGGALLLTVRRLRGRAVRSAGPEQD